MQHITFTRLFNTILNVKLIITLLAIYLQSTLFSFRNIGNHIWKSSASTVFSRARSTLLYSAFNSCCIIGVAESKLCEIFDCVFPSSRSGQCNRNTNTLIEIDGGVGLQNAESLLKAGADVLVAGSSVFKSENPLDTISRMKAIGKDVFQA